jgi:hypothetical protein
MATELTEPSEERVVKHKVFRYFLERYDTIRPDQVVTVQRLARSGETVQLRSVDAARGDSLGAFYTSEELAARESAGEAPVEPSPSSVDLTELDEGELKAWLEGELEGHKKPSIPQVLSAVNAVADEEDRATIASAVKDAEESADHDTRTSLIEKLDALTEEDEED